jgi:pyruvate dehydrogenase E1 component
LAGKFHFFSVPTLFFQIICEENEPGIQKKIMKNNSGKIKKIENKEWIDSINWVIDHSSTDRVEELLDLIRDEADKKGIKIRGKKSGEKYINTIDASEETDYPGDPEIEKKILQAVRWNAMAMVVNANKTIEGIGGHISTYSSISQLFETGFNHFFHGYDKGNPDCIYFQGHAAPGVYARSFLEHRLDEKALKFFRRELQDEEGLPSYPHPNAMPDYWRFPTVSMGLAPIQAIYQARFFKYLEDRGLAENGKKVWAFLGDGEMDEPESTGALTIASRDNLDNLIFVVNCNLQRLDGPVRGNSKIIRELEQLFNGAGWNVIKVLWGSAWDELFEKDQAPELIDTLESVPDGTVQKWNQLEPEELRDEMLEKNENLEKLLKSFDTSRLHDLIPGGHDPVKVYHAYKKAVESNDGPTVILAQTVKGFEQGDAGEASNVTHKQKTFDPEQLKSFRDKMEIPIEDEKLKDQVPYFRFDRDSREFKYLKERRESLDGWLPKRKNLAGDFQLPKTKIFENYHEGSGKKEVTTTSVFVQILSRLLKDKNIKDRIVPIIPDESRTFGMDALFSSAGIYSRKGQRYEPVDKGSLLYYNEEKTGAIIEEGISEAGSMATFMAAGNNHLWNDFHSVPFYVFYSMFGFQRIGDLIWAAADAGSKGFLIGGISGRTSLSGEGLQHADGQSHLYALAYPNLKAYDPAFAYELAVIVKNGISEMYKEDKNQMYYITLSNQAYEMPKMPSKSEKDILKGMYRFYSSRKRKNKEMTINLMGSGAIMAEVIRARDVLENEFDIPANIWSVTSYKALYEQAHESEEADISNSEKTKSFIEKSLQDNGKIFIAATDYVKALPLTIARWVPGDYLALGTDGFGKSDSTPELRAHFKVSAQNILEGAFYSLYNMDLINKKEWKSKKKKLKKMTS